MQQLGADGWLGIGWPKEHGGQGRGPIEQFIFFDEVQRADHTYTPFVDAEDAPATHLNREIMARFREEMKTYYYQPEKYDTYLEQLGISYPTVREEPEQ